MMTDQQPAPQPERRKPFQTVLTEHAGSFTQFILDEIPELEAIAIVFSYAIPNGDLPYAVVMGQNEALKSPGEIVHMCQQLWRTLNYQIQNGYKCIQILDEYMGEKARELQQLQDKIDAATRELAVVQPGGPDAP